MIGRRASLAVAAAVLAVTALVAAGAFTWSDPGAPDGAATPAAGTDDPASALETLHRGDVTGEGVAVGVVDVTGYALEHPRLSGRVVDAVTFDSGSDPASGGRYTHGTAAAATVTAAAPDADLYLATATTPAEFRRAVRWLLDRGVDVVVAPVTFYGQPDDGTAAVSRAAARATARGVVFVAPTGNLAERHRLGRDDGPGRTVAFDDDERTRLRGNAERLVLWLSWDRAHRAANFTAVLYREDGNRSRPVARSQPYRGDHPSERITTAVDPGGRYVVEVKGPNRSTGATVELESPSHRLEGATARGSIAAPATADDVLAVGAYDQHRRGLAPYTSRGPTLDGRPGVDVVAPARPIEGVAGERFAGSSLSAAYVAGVAALLLSADPGLAPGHVELALEATAIDVGRPGYGFAGGHGRVAPVRAARQVGAVESVPDRTTGPT